MDSIKLAFIAAFLKEFKKLAVVNEEDIFVDRTEYEKGFIELGITKDIAFQEVLSLSIEDYCKGPEADRDRPGEVWEFGIDIDGMGVYVKLKIAEINGKKYAKCISFHKAQFPQYYPFKKMR